MLKVRVDKMEEEGQDIYEVRQQVRRVPSLTPAPRVLTRSPNSAACTPTACR